jgi:hypothetical protein
VNAHPLDVLEHALEAEREALLGHDVEALVRSTEAKLAALRAVEGAAPPLDAHQRVQALAELNRQNGLLLARRRRAVGFALRQLGRSDGPSGYDARGKAASAYTSRALAVA